MARVLLEDSWNFKVDRGQIQESKVGKLTSVSIPGILSQADVVNGNGRRYSRAVWEANLKEGSQLMQLINGNEAFGTLEHPENGQVDLNSPISHKVSKIKMQEDGTVVGEITIFDDLPEGHRLRVLIENGYDPLVSSRGFGSIVKGQDGVDEVQLDFVCEGWDVVMRPSFKNARLTPQRESTNLVTGNLAVTENLEGGRVAGSSETEKAPVSTMDINTIRQNVASLRLIDPATASARQIAESFSMAENLSRQLTEESVTNPKAAYDCKRLVEEIDAIEKSWSDNVDAIRKDNAALRATNAKLLAVAESLAKTARLYRTQLGEAQKKRVSSAEVFEAVAQRGRGWHKIAETRSKKVSTLEHQVAVSCAAIDMLADRVKGGDNLAAHKLALEKLSEKYHADTAKLARALVEAKYPEQVKQPDIAKALGEANTAKAVEAVRTQIEESLKPKSGKPAVTETAKPGTPAPQLTETANNSWMEGRHSFSMEESVDLAARLAGRGLVSK